MKPIEVGFDGKIKMFVTAGKEVTVNFASFPEHMKISDLHECKNYNLNGVVHNTFIWWRKEEQSELIYFNKDGNYFRVNFEPIKEDEL